MTTNSSSHNILHVTTTEESTEFWEEFSRDTTEGWMRQALGCAYEALGIYSNEQMHEASSGTREVPIAAIFVHERTRQIIGRAHNTPNLTLNPTNHAEILILNEIYEKADSHDDAKTLLEECICVVTIEPCVMCCAALQLAGVTKIIYGAENSKFGGCRGALNVTDWMELDMKIMRGILEEESLRPLRMFYMNPNTKVEDARALAGHGVDSSTENTQTTTDLQTTSITTEVTTINEQSREKKVRQNRKRKRQKDT